MYGRVIEGDAHHIAQFTQGVIETVLLRFQQTVEFPVAAAADAVFDQQLVEGNGRDLAQVTAEETSVFRRDENDSRFAEGSPSGQKTLLVFAVEQGVEPVALI